jgi:hypothetical protein
LYLLGFAPSRLSDKTPMSSWFYWITSAASCTCIQLPCESGLRDGFSIITDLLKSEIFDPNRDFYCNHIRLQCQEWGTTKTGDISPPAVSIEADFQGAPSMEAVIRFSAICLVRRDLIVNHSETGLYRIHKSCQG